MKKEDRQFKVFKDECERMINLFWLTWFGYRIEKEQGKRGEILARFSYNPLSDMLCEIQLYVDVAKDCSNEEIRKYAQHEVLHMLLVRMAEYNHKRMVTEEMQIEAEHEVIQRILNSGILNK